MNLMNILMMASSQQGGSGMSSSIVMIILMIAIFYFFMIRPQQKRQKEEKKFRESLQKGQQIVTIGGMHGKIAEVKETTVVIEVAHDVKIEMEKASIAMSVVNQK
ncbi:MAG: preprotein translocase subunit YajC [Bacteroidales bacterium]|nr:preprotein translocase subunit YajC [Bacteroidales bacterium]